MVNTPYFRKNREQENNLAKIRVEEGFTVQRLAQKIGTHASLLTGLQNGMTSPFYCHSHNGKIKPYVLKLSEVLHASLSELFPRDICEIARRELPLDQEAEMLMGEYSQYMGKGMSDYGEHKEIIFNLLSILTPREKKIIKALFLFGFTLKEVGIDLMLTTERVRQIQFKAIRKIKKRSIKNRNGIL